MTPTATVRLPSDAGLKSFKHDTTIPLLTTGHDKLIATNDGEDALQSEVIPNTSRRRHRCHQSNQTTFLRGVN